MCFNSLTTMQLAVYASCGLHSLNVSLLPGYMVSTSFCISSLTSLLWASLFRSFGNRILRGMHSELNMKAFPALDFSSEGGPFPVHINIVVATLQILPVLKVQGVTACFDKHVTWLCRGVYL